MKIEAWRNIFWLSLGIIMFFLLLSVHLNRWISPTFFPYFEFVALLYPILFFGFLLYWLTWLPIKPKWWLWGIIPLLVVGFPLKNNFNPLGQGEAKPTDYKLITYNVRFLKHQEEINHWLASENPDFICLQEIYQRQSTDLSFWVEKGYYYRKTDYMSFISKHPIIATNLVEGAEDYSRTFYCDVVKGVDTLRIFNCHLASMQINKEMLKGSVDKEQYAKQGEKLQNQLIRGFRKHEEQLRALIPQIKESPFPTIVAGDFNSVPLSYEYFQLTKVLRDAFPWKGNLIGNTFLDYKYPIKIDYVFHSKEVEVSYYNIDHQINYSDHQPTLIYFGVE